MMSMIFPILSGIIQPVFAADYPLNVYIDNNGYNKSTKTLKIYWGAVDDVDNCTIVYHVPNGNSFSEVKLIGSVDSPNSQIDLTNNSATITNIKNDIIYDFEIKLENSSGETYIGARYFLAQVSVYSEQVDQQPVPVIGGGVESGIYPAIRLSWNMPKVYVFDNLTQTGSMKYANDSAALAALDGSIEKMNFTFNINETTQKSLANVIVDMDTTDITHNTYKASISNDTNRFRFSSVKWDDGKLSFYILGVKDKTTLIPDIADIRANTYNDETKLYTLPKGISDLGETQYVLPHQEILPGSIYKISMNTVLLNSSKEYVNVASLTNAIINNPLIDIDNPLMGTIANPLIDYTYTPVRFQLTKDASDNIYVGIHRVNSGSLSMPNLYYEIQSNNVPSSQDSSWTTRKKLMDNNFQGEYAITGITGTNSQNTVYYRVVVKSDGATDKIQSLKLPYTMQDDTARPPVPNKISIKKVDLVLPPTGITDTSSDITISWDKPSNWDQIKGHLENDIFYHFLINVNEKDLDAEHTISPDPVLEANGKNYGRYEANYRLVKYISANALNSDGSDKIKVSPDGTKLIYTLKGYELFKGEDADPDITYDIPNTDNYPTYLLPNKTYYLQMYTTFAADKGVFNDSSKMSEKSLTASFTTLSPSGRDVPTPKHLEWVKTTINPSTATKPTIDATVDIRFDALKIDWSNYTSNAVTTNNEVIYDLYMSNTGTDLSNFQMIGTTYSKSPKGDVEFTKSDLEDTTWFNATINTFTDSSTFNNNTLFGKSLSPNTTYYFMVKVRLKIVGGNNDETFQNSIGTVLLPVTTPRGEATTPDNTALKPVAPTDFSIALDKNGNPMVDGQSVTFEWTVKESEAAYKLIATTNKVAADTLLEDNSIQDDAIYKSFISIFGSKDRDGDATKLTLDPNKNPLPENLVYDSTTKKCRYTINTWLYPNKIYYFSLRSELLDGTKPKSSVWVSIPVTTALIESPTMLQVVNDCELAFYWIDSKSQMTSENYSISLKASSDSDYTLLAKSQYKIVKDDSVYYARTTPAAKLKPNTQYTIKIIRTIDNVVLSTIVRETRDDYYQIDVKWQGYAIDAYSGFEIAIKTEDATDYTVLDNDVDLEWYRDISTHDYPYYIEKDYNNINNNYYIFNARIKLAEVTLPDGTKEHKPLAPNIKYYIKVRAVKTDSSNSSVVTPSKYAGPVDTRTEFNQDDYDNTDNNTNITAKFLDMLEKLEQDVVWEISKQNGVTNKILVKDDKIINLLEGLGNYSYTIDMSQSSDYINSDEIYLAKDILKAIKSNDRSVIIKTKNAEYTIRPETFNIDDMEEFKNAKKVTGSKDVYLKLSNIQSTSIEPSAPANTTSSSKMSVLSAQAVVSKKTTASVNALIKDKLYNDKTGIVQKKLAIIKNPNNLKNKKDAEEINAYLNQLYEEVKSELSFYLEDTLNGTGYTSGVLADKYNISKFSSPLSIKMPYKANSISNPYVIYGSIGKWKKLTQNLKYEKGYLNFFVTSTGKYAIFSSKDIAASVANDSVAKPYISKLAASYDLTTVFPGADVSFNSELNVTVKEAILLYELLLESQNNVQTDVKAKAKAYGIDKIINITNVYRNITRQEAAVITIKLYCQKTGADYDKLKASYSKVIKDDSKIDEKYSIPVYLCLQMKIMTLDSSTNFNPKATINRAEIATVLQKMLET